MSLRFAAAVSLCVLASCAGPDYGFELASSNACSAMHCSPCARQDFFVDGDYRYDSCQDVGASADLPSPRGAHCSGFFNACQSNAGQVFTEEYGPSGVAASSTMASKYASCSDSSGDFQVWGVEHANSGGCPHDLYFVLHCMGGASGAASYSCARYIEAVSDFSCDGMTLHEGDDYLQFLTLTRIGPPGC